MKKTKYMTFAHNKIVHKIDVSELTLKQALKAMEEKLYILKHKKGKPIEPKYWC